MKDVLFLKRFFEVIEEKRKSEGKDMWGGKTARTAFMGDVMEGIAKKINCKVIHRDKEKKRSGEYLNIDAFFIERDKYVPEYNYPWDPFVLPRAVVELENDHNHNKIRSCLWKIICIRAPIRVLICYQSNESNVMKLKQELETDIRHGGLMQRTEGDLLVIVGDERKEDRCWGEYFTVFEWRSDSLKKVERIEWYPENA